jgi:VWFA-related protein
MRTTLAILLGALLIASAQQTATQPGAAPQKKAAPAKAGGAKQDTAPSKKTFSFSETVQLVVVDIFAKDKDGNPIPGLKAGDFTVSEDGKPQKIEFCEYQELKNDVVTTALATEVLTPRAEAEVKAVEPPKAEVKAVTNNQIASAKPGEIKYKDRRLMALFFDMTSMPIADQMRAQDAAVKFIKTQITPSDLVAIMTFSSEVKVIEDFTDDRDKLIKDIKKLTIGEGSGFDAADTDTDTGAAFTADDSEFNIFNTDRQLSALETAARMLGALPEKKALVYFSSGLTRSGSDNQAQMTATVNSAIKANVAFYPIDARGLVAQAPLGDATKGTSGGGGNMNGSSGRGQQSAMQGQQESLTMLAADTGGKALLDNTDLSAGIVQAQKDISSYYIVGYNSQNQNLDGHYRKIDVKIKKDLAAKLDYRHGYFASKTFGKQDASDKERQLSDALMLGDPITDIEVKAEIDYFRLARDRYFVPVEVKIPGSDLEMAKHGNAERTRLDFIGVVKDSKGEVTGGGNVRDYVDLELKGDKAAEITKHPIAYDTGFTLKPGAYTLKFLVRENETGKIGTFQQKFVIPDLTTDQPSLPTSSVILSNQIQPLNEALYSAEKNQRLLVANPLVADKQKLIPSVTRVFKKSQDMYVYVETYEPLAATTEPVVAAVSFFRGKTKAFETEPLVVKEGLDAKSKALPVRFSVPLGRLTPGKYTCQVTLHNLAAKKSSYTRAEIYIVN